MTNTPDDLRYTADHEWARADGSVVRVGITDYAQNQLGDVVFVSLPEVGATASAGEPLGEVESTKSVSEINAPVTGTVSARNDALDDDPATINTDPYGTGWLFEISADDPTALQQALDGLLDAAAYRGMADGG